MRVRPASAALRHVGFALLLLIGADFAAAQPYPSRPIRIVVPLPPGANGDLMPRILAQHLSAKFGQPVVIENRPGAAQNLGAEMCLPLGARRLHAVCHAAGPAGDQPELFSQARLRSDAVRAGHDHGEAALHPGGASQGAGVELRRVHRLREGQSEQAQRCVALDRQRPASDRRDAEARRRHQDDACALFRDGAGAERSARRPRRDDVRQSRQQPAAGAGGQAEGARRHRRQARARAAGSAGDRGDLSRGARRRAGSPSSRRRRRRRRSRRSCRRPSPRFSTIPRSSGAGAR